MKLIILNLLSFIILITRIYGNGIAFFGVVQDSLTGEPLIGVNIFSDSLKIGTISNEDGYFYFTIKSADKKAITISLQYVGYKTKAVNLSRFNSFITVKLVPQPFQADEVTVYGEKNNNDYNLYYKFISPLEIKKYASLGDADIFRYLSSISGVSFTNDISNKIYIRGMRSDKLFVFFDDFVLYNPYHLLNITGSIDVGSIKTIEFYKSAYPVSETGRIGGMLKLYSKKGDTSRFRLNIDASLMSSIIRLQGPLLNGSYFFSFRRTYIDFLTKLISDEIPYSFYDVIAKVNLKLGNRQNFQISGIMNRDHFKTTDNTPSNWSNQAMGINWKYYYNHKIYFHQYAYFSQYKSLFFSDSSRNVKDRIKEFSYKGKFFYHLDILSTLLNAGWSFHYFNVFFNTSDLSLQIFNDRSIGKETDLFFSALSKPLNNLHVEIGSGISYLDLLKNFHATPLVRFKYLFSDSLRIEACYARKIQYLHTVNNERDIFPPFNIWRIVKQSHGPESSNQFSLSFYKELMGTNLKAEIYYNQLSSIVDFNRRYISKDDPLFLSNNGESYGLELGTDYSNKYLSINMNYSLSRTIYTMFGKSYYPSFHRMHKMDINIYTKKIKNWLISLHWVFSNGRPYTRILGFYPLFYFIDSANRGNDIIEPYYSKINQAYYPYYHRLDFHIEKWFSKNFKIYFDLINVYNRKNILYYEFNSATHKLKATTMLPVLPSIGFTYEL